MKHLKIQDDFTLLPGELTDEMKDFIQQASPTGTSRLRVKVAATHSGRVTRNHMLYLPNYMRDSISTWLTPFKKPILLHHDSYDDPIGRVVDARYVDLSNGIRDHYSNIDLIQDAKAKIVSPVLMDAFLTGKLSVRETVDFCNQWLISDGGFAEDDDYEGLGYIELVFDVSDPAAIQKVLDQRYLTGSVSASTDRAICSICRRDWMSDDEEDVCEHQPGKIYDGQKCVLIAGNFNYQEYSFVNSPADTKSQILSIGDSTGQEIKTVSFSEDSLTSDVPKTMLIYDSFERPVPEDIKMEKLTLEDAIKLLEDKKYTPEDAKTKTEVILKHIEDNNLFACDECQAADIFLTAHDKLYPVVDVNTNTTTNTDVSDTSTNTSADTEEDLVKVALGDEYEAIAGEDEEGRHYAEMVAFILTGEDQELASLLKDAKLTAAARKKLSKSTFCKPPDKYPVNDCAHAKSAMAYAKKYNESSSVLACIRRKAKRLGCPFGDETEVDLGQFVADWFDIFSDEQIAQLFHGLLNVAGEREIDLPLQVQQEDAANLQTLKDENQKLQIEIQQTEDTLTERTKQIQDLQVERLLDLACLANTTIEDLDTYTQDLSSKTEVDRATLLKDYESKVDRVVIQEKLRTGLTNTPEGSVDNPLQDRDNQQRTDTQQEKKLTPEQIEQIRENILRMRLNPGGQHAVDATLAALANQGYNTQDIFREE